MIKINKPVKCPKILLTTGEANKRLLCEAFENGKQEFKRTDFQPTYARLTVKRALFQSQHGKCCYCETRINDKGSPVEHFRPALKYYWLAYDWTNLLLACSDCNSVYKRDAFPLKNEKQRVKSHKDDSKIDQELPLLINPAKVEPTRFIAFRNQYPYPIKNNLIGKTTIQVLGLDREVLNSRRRDLLQLIERMIDIAAMQIPESIEARKLLETTFTERTKDSAEFAATVRCARARNFYPRTL